MISFYSLALIPVVCGDVFCTFVVRFVLYFSPNSTSSPPLKKIMILGPNEKQCRNQNSEHCVVFQVCFCIFIIMLKTNRNFQNW